MPKFRDRTVSIAAFALTAVIAMGSALLAVPMGIFVFSSGWLCGNLASAMFVPALPGQNYAWPFSAAIGLLADSGFSDSAKEVIGFLGLGGGVLAAALICGAILSLPQVVFAKVMYGVRFRKKHWWWTILANTVYALSFGIIGMAAFMSSFSVSFGASAGPAMLFPVFIAFVMLCITQHAINRHAARQTGE